MIETHPFKAFVPENASVLILGSFTSKKPNENINYDFYYANGRNQFWSIIEKVYNLSLDTTKKKQELFSKLGIAISDIIYQCERKSNSSLDTNLVNFIYNFEAIEKILESKNIQRILFSSRFVEKEYKKIFKAQIKMYPKIELITLPSPSPRYAILSKDEKRAIYAEILPKLVRNVHTTASQEPPRTQLEPNV